MQPLYRLAPTFGDGRCSDIHERDTIGAVALRVHTVHAKILINAANNQATLVDALRSIYEGSTDPIARQVAFDAMRSAGVA